MPPEPPEWLTPQEVAAQMRVSKMTVSRLIHSGQLPATRVGRSMRIKSKDWSSYLRKNQVEPTQPMAG